MRSSAWFGAGRREREREREEKEHRCAVWWRTGKRKESYNVDVPTDVCVYVNSD